MSDYLARVNFRDLVKVLGRDKAVNLCVKHGNQRLPSTIAIYRLIRDQAICHSFNGKNISELAKSNSISERQARRILFKKHKILT